MVFYFRVQNGCVTGAQTLNLKLSTPSVLIRNPISKQTTISTNHSPK